MKRATSPGLDGRWRRYAAAPAACFRALSAVWSPLEPHGGRTGGVAPR